MSNKLVYLAGAMGCYDHDDDYPYAWRRNAREYFEKYSDYYGKNIEIFNPVNYYNYRCKNQKTEREIMKFEFNRLKQCDVMLVNLKDLDKSIGTSDEILFAYLNHIPVIGFLEDETKLNNIHPWKHDEQIDLIEVGEYALKSAIQYISEFYG